MVYNALIIMCTSALIHGKKKANGAKVYLSVVYNALIIMCTSALIHGKKKANGANLYTFAPLAFFLPWISALVHIIMSALYTTDIIIQECIWCSYTSCPHILKPHFRGLHVCMPLFSPQLVRIGGFKRHK